MTPILKNPYRVIGVLAGSSAKEELNKTKRLKMFLEADQEPDEDYSFPALGQLERTPGIVDTAKARLNLNNDRVNAALFWFYNGRAITDEPAFDALKDSNEWQAVEIWSKLTSTTDVSPRNCSAFHNLSNIKLSKAFTGAVDIDLLEEGLALKLKFLDSDYYEDFIKIIADETYKTSKEELQKLFLRQVQEEIDRSGKLTSLKYLEIINKLTFSAKEAYLKEVVQKPIETIEKKIEETRARRKKSSTLGITLGKELFLHTQPVLQLIKNILGNSDIKYISISDKVSDEILQCGIDYFKTNQNSNIDPGNDTADLFRKAKSLAIGNIAKQRCQENIDNLQDWIDEKPEREKQKKIESDLSLLLAVFEEYDDVAETIANAKSFISRCKPRLTNIKDALGSSDDMYLKISTRVAGQAQSYVISEFNRVQDVLMKKLATLYSDYEKRAVFTVFREKLQEAYSVMVTIRSLDMEYDFKINHYQKNFQVIKDMCDKMGVSSSASSHSSPSSYRTTSTSRSTTTSDSEFPSWLGWVIGIIIFIIAAKTCN